MMVSRRRLAGRRRLPRAASDWALDSGGFTELSMHGRWLIDAHTYVREVRRYADEIGRLQWAAPMDWMTEDHVLARTGASLLTHQRRTVDNFLELRNIAADLPFIPVLQGQTVSDYHRCADLYERHGVELAQVPLVGLGSVCRRQNSREVDEIVRSLGARAPQLHAFGVKTLGLQRFADAIASSDSAAWSLRGRYEPGCSLSHRRESNCLEFALTWRARLLSSLDDCGAQQQSICHGRHHLDAMSRSGKRSLVRGRRPRHPPPSRPPTQVHPFGELLSPGAPNYRAQYGSR
jgi:hypothetical protein